MTLRRRELLAAGLAAPLLAAPLRAQTAAPPPYRFPGAAERREDAALLARAYRTLHPGLLRYNSDASLDAAAARLLAEAGAAESPEALWLAATRFTAALRCGHSWVSPYNQGRAFTALVNDRVGRLPFRFRWIGRRMIVTATTPALPELRIGSEIVSLDGEAAAALRARLLPLARADGHNDAKRLDLLGSPGVSRYEDFDFLRHVTAPRRRDDCDLVWRTPDGRTMRGTAGLLLDPGKAVAEAADAADAPVFRRALVGEGRALLLTMPTWAVYDSKWDWRGFIDASVDQAIAEKRPAIIVDLRDNEGGLDCGDVLLARLITAPLPAPAGARRCRYRTTPADLDPMLDTWDDSFRKLGVGAAGPDREGFYRLADAGSDGGGAILPKGPRYQGKLIVLISATCSSATFQFAARVRRHRLGTLVGEPTGGNRRGINGGAFFFLRLPHSRLEADLPLIGYYPATREPDAGVLPDVPAAPTPASVAAGIDLGLAAALRLV